MSEQKRLALVAGAGPGLGEALLRRFAEGGYHAVGLARTDRTTDDGIEVRGANLTCPKTVGAVTKALLARHGTPAIVVHNPARLVIGSFSETPLESFEDAWRSMVLSAVILAQAVIPPMVRGGGGTFLVSGATASLRGGAKFAAFASAKFALRGLTQSLSREYQSRGVHIAHVILDGIIDTPASRALHGIAPARMMNPAEIAEAYWQLAHQPKSAWTQELDLRPMSEAF